MPWVEFTDRFAWDVPGRGGRETHVFEAGATKNVVRACATAAVKAGKAKRIKTPTRTQAEAYAQRR